MVRKNQITVCALNLDATPHPEGIYVTLLRRASEFLVKAHGNDYAKITSPRKNYRGDLYTGRILVFTEIDIRGRWLDLRNEDELSLTLKEAITIPENARPNFRSFDYVFDEKKHRLYFESQNIEGQSLGPTTARRIFASLLSGELLGINVPDVEVTVIPDKRALSKILTLPGLRKLYIRVASPNADGASPEAKKRVMDRLKTANAKKLEETYTKRSDANALTPTDEIRDLAEVASETGIVRAEGRDANNKKIEVSTDQIPKRGYIDVEAGGSFIAKLLGTLGLF